MNGNQKENGHREVELEFFGSTERKKMHRLHSANFDSRELKVPANTRNFIERSRVLQVDRDLRVIYFAVHMHYRGIAAKILYWPPDGSAPRVLGSIPYYRYKYSNGTGSYLKPILIPRGSKLQLECNFDNSRFNSDNPNPNADVGYGHVPESAEMCFSQLAYYFEND
jgi:hypothetical protein